MITYVPINLTTEFQKNSDELRSALEDVFKYTPKVLVYALFNIKSPLEIEGNYSVILFIKVPFEAENYWKTKSKIYLNTLVLGIKDMYEPDVISVDGEWMHSEEGSWNYIDEINNEKKKWHRAVRRHFQDIKWFRMHVHYNLTASPAVEPFYGKYLYCNRKYNYYYAIISKAVEDTQSNNAPRTDCIGFEENAVGDFDTFVADFVSMIEEKNSIGELTQKKAKLIRKREQNRPTQKLIENIGQSLGILHGKAGTGKTLSLMSIINNRLNQPDIKNHRCRLLTFNNMLIMDLKQMAKELPASNASISIKTLHSFFYDVFKKSPVSLLYLDPSKEDELFDKCTRRASRYTVLFNSMDQKPSDAMDVIEKNRTKIANNELPELFQFAQYLESKHIDFGKVTSEDLNGYIRDYVSWKREIYKADIASSAYLSMYEQILKQIYLLLKNEEEFYRQFQMRPLVENEMVDEAIFNDPVFKKKCAEFIKKCQQSMENEFDAEPISGELSFASLRNEVSQAIGVNDDSVYQRYDSDVTKVKRQSKWQGLVLVDEAQDCSMWEKAVLMQMFGPENIIIATGGKDQLIRRSVENDWSKLFKQDVNVFREYLTHSSKRQHRNIANFINAFAKEFRLSTQFEFTENTPRLGEIVIDIRSGIPDRTIPEDIAETFSKSGRAAGCSNFEGMIVMLPHKGYVNTIQQGRHRIELDEYETVRIGDEENDHTINIIKPDFMEIIDCTINSKGRLLEEVDSKHVRAMFYDSCRGLEAWSTMCIDLDEFYYEKMESEDAQNYAVENTQFMGADREILIEQFASIWMFMVLTRPIHNLYIKIRNPHSEFSERLLRIAEGLDGVKILRGDYTSQNPSQPAIQSNPNTNPFIEDEFPF